MTVAVAHSPTPEGLAALRLAAREAVVRKTDLAVLRILDTVEHASDPARVAQVRAQVEEHLLQAEASPDLDWRLEVTSSGGDVAEALIDLAVAVDADPFVIGSRRRTPIGKLFLGSTVQRVLLDAPMAVLVTKP